MRFRGLAAALVLSLLAAGHSVGARPRVGTQGSPTVSSQQEAAFKKGGYAAAAAITGSYVRIVEGTEASPSSLDDLVSASQVIVIASAVRSRGLVVPRGDSIRTHYVFSIESILKWEVDTSNADRSTTISVNGGRADLPGGRWAQEIVTDYVLPVNGQRYVLFLNPIPPRTFTRPDPLDTPDAEFWPLLGAHGIYLLGEKVWPAVTRLRSSVSPSMRFRGADPNAFLTDVRESVQKALDDVLTHRNGVPLSRVLRDPRARGLSATCSFRLAPTK